MIPKLRYSVIRFLPASIDHWYFCTCNIFTQGSIKFSLLFCYGCSRHIYWKKSNLVFTSRCYGISPTVSSQKFYHLGKNNIVHWQKQPQTFPIKVCEWNLYWKNIHASFKKISRQYFVLFLYFRKLMMQDILVHAA